jgi:hypothetical protein
MADRKDQDIEDVMREEGSRGKRRRKVDTTTAEQQARIRTKMLEAIRHGDESLFVEAILDLGHAPGSPEYDEYLKKWRENVGASRR